MGMQGIKHITRREILLDVTVERGRGNAIENDARYLKDQR